MTTTRPTLRRAWAIGTAVLVGALSLVLVAAPAAEAHVTVGASTTTPGAYTVLTFQVPTESENASTVSVTVELPQDDPFTSVETETEPVPGWTATTTGTSVTWKADAGGLRPGQFGQFCLAVGPLPESGMVFLPAVQTYSDGEVVRWVQQASGSAEPEHPAPSVVVDTATPSATPEAASSGARDPWGVGLGVAGLVVAVAAAALAASALRRTRTRS